MKRKTKITNYIFALIVVYFCGPAILWGFEGFVTAFFLAVIVLMMAMLWFMIYMFLETLK